MNLDDLVLEAGKMGATDLHIIQGKPPIIRVDGLLKKMNDTIMTDVDCDRIALRLVGVQVENVYTKGEVDLARSVDDLRCRISLFRRQGIWSLAIRLLSNEIPKFETLGLPAVVKSFIRFNQGLVLVVGKTGSGKSTTLASLLNILNQTESMHILTLEDPVEYVYPDASCAVNQREVGKDTQTFATGLRAALREDPDVILVGELRDYETIEVAITAAETGHLVFGTVHANSAAATIDRLVGVFQAEKQTQIRMQLSMSLRAVLCQRLLPKVGGGRILSCEVMQVDQTIRELIREGKTFKIPDVIKNTSATGNILMQDYLRYLAIHNFIAEPVYRSVLEDLS